MRPDDLPGLDGDLEELWRQLIRLHERLRDHTWQTWRRANPFAEDLFDWREKGGFLGADGVTVYDSATITGDVTIGEGSWIGPFCELDGTGGLTIGRFCALSAAAQVITHDVVRWALSGGRAPYEYAPVTIEDCCFVGAGAVITKGVTVGTQSVLAAGAVVVDDVEPRTIVGGVPARPIGRVELEGDEIRLVYDRDSQSR